MSSTSLRWDKSDFYCVGQQVDDEILVQMMVNDEISDSQGIENDSILAGVTSLCFLTWLITLAHISADIKQPDDDEELLDDDL